MGRVVPSVVALMRAPEDASRTAQSLAAGGFASAIAPVFALEALPAVFPEGRFDAVVATSAKSIAFAVIEIDASISAPTKRHTAPGRPDSLISRSSSHPRDRAGFIWRVLLHALSFDK